MTILVSGARGKVGAALIRTLLASGHQVRAASAEPSQLILPENVTAVGFNPDQPDSLKQAFEGVEAVFLYAIRNGIENVIAAAEQAGVQRAVLLSSGSASEPDAEQQPLAMMHLVVERALAASTLSFSALRPGAFATNDLAWLAEIKQSGTVSLPYPEARQTPIHELDLAESAAAILTGSVQAEQVHQLSGPDLISFREQVAAIAQATGKPITVTEISRQQAAAQLAQNMPAAFVETLLDYWQQGVDSTEQPSDQVELLTGRPARSFRQWALDHAEDFG